MNDIVVNQVTTKRKKKVLIKDHMELLLYQDEFWRT